MNPATPIRKATVADASTVLEINMEAVLQLCVSHYDKSLLEQWMGWRTPELYAKLIAEQDGFFVFEQQAVVGFCHATPDEIQAIYVRPDHAGRGIGSCLLAHAIRHASIGPSEFIRVEASFNAVSFYQRHGFRIVKTSTIERRGMVFPITVMEIGKCEPCAPPNGGPATQLGNSEVLKGPPSVS